MEKKLLSFVAVIALSGAGALPSHLMCFGSPEANGILIKLIRCGGLLPMTVHGATMAELQAQLTALLAQVAALQAQLAASGSATTGAVPASILSSGDLTVGSRGAAVTDLQNYLGMSTVTGYFGNLTKAALAKFQADNGISPATGYFGAKTREKLSAINKAGASIPESAEQPSTPTPVLEIIPATTTPAPAPAASLPSPFQSTLVFETTYPSGTLNTNYGDKILTEFKLKATEKIAINRIRFTSVGTVRDDKLINFKLFNSQTNEVLATVSDPVSRIIEFKMTPDSSKSDKGLMVSGKTYYVMATLITLNIGDIKPHIKLDIASVSDISAFDYDDLTRVADISKTNVFPIEGPKITTR